MTKRIAGIFQRLRRLFRKHGKRKPDLEKVWSDSIIHHGPTMMSVICMEENAELIQAISKMLRGKDARANLVEEMADTQICHHLLQEMYGISDREVQEVIVQKTLREQQRMHDSREIAKQQA
ncbi:hypothetical protein [Bifidobacterium oedipodis]|uniref:Uncharacterized protein n=1 Tax=Bifidobacterium oedipodis TaxID=2675322 RepID=A0A7Y0HRD0_9BIFI|nr:hypothetical protein [Bifidobacterium sp. DSM 109957]NMM93915.1 hypothetical protein [Bifidobacterium sp. DSM 109957]